MSTQNQPRKLKEKTEDRTNEQTVAISQKIDLVFKNAAAAERNINDLVNSSSDPVDMANKMSKTLKSIELIQMTCYKYRVMFKNNPPLFIENKLNSDLRIIDRIEKTVSGMLLTESISSDTKTVH